MRVRCSDKSLDRVLHEVECVDIDETSDDGDLFSFTRVERFFRTVMYLLSVVVDGRPPKGGSRREEREKGESGSSRREPSIKAPLCVCAPACWCVWVL